MSEYSLNTVTYDGFPGKPLCLYHVTDADSARKIVNINKMLRGSEGMYGGGIYFAEGVEQAYRKAHRTGAHIMAIVEVGRSVHLEVPGLP